MFILNSGLKSADCVYQQHVSHPKHFFVSVCVKQEIYESHEEEVRASSSVSASYKCLTGPRKFFF